MSLAKLSGSDYFHLLIDRKMLRAGLAGNISRIHFELDELADLSQISEQLRKNKHLIYANSLRYQLCWPLLPVWRQTDNPKECVSVSENITDLDFESTVTNRKVENDSGLVFVDLCQLDDDSKHVVISMHHSLFDYQGMMNFVRALNNDFDGPLFPTPTKISGFKLLQDFHYMTVYMLSCHAWKLGSLLPKKPLKKATVAYKELEYNAEEAKAIDTNAWHAGSRIGTSGYLIASTAISVHKTLLARGEKPPYLFFSIPHNQRKLGTVGHLYSNQLSFLFFRLSVNDLTSTENAVNSINFQLKQQIKNRIVERYANLLSSMRFVPMFLYEKMVNLASKGRLASFGFSDLGIEQLNFDQWLGAKVKTVKRYPPVPIPPGISVATTKLDDGRKIVIAYGKEILSESEVEKLAAEFSTISSIPTP